MLVKSKRKIYFGRVFQPVGFEFVDLAIELEKLFKHKVDLVSRKAIRPKMLPFIEKDLVYV